MKSSRLRKRYILVECQNREALLSMEARVSPLGVRRKYWRGRYAIYLANQFNKNDAIDLMNSVDGVRTLLTSGSIRKLKGLTGNGGMPPPYQRYGARRQ
ncbi:hypothetical protein [Thermogymnomonas acidicola]|uniref:hypothetical protein n=1 Tax=Thermogymnomonas acidicola TaxID=399579 RepID=UPI001E2E57B5|nr:hypothetical protein [Thermogymnomonas acidicola]